jgi:hypothetical protein
MNHATPWAASVTQFTAASMNPALEALDKAITYHKLALVGCDGALTWTSATGVLDWTGAIHIYFTSAAGNAVHNSIATGNITLADGEFAYVTLSETPDAALTMSKASIGAGSASAFKAYNILVMGYRNTVDDGFYPEELAGVFTQQVAGGTFVEKSTFDAQSVLAAVSDNTPVAVTVAEQRILGRKTGGNIAALTGAEVLTLANAMQAGQQQITCADNVTVDWSAGSTAYMTFDRDSVALTFSNPVAGQVYRLLAKQSAGGSDVFTYATTIKWRGGSAPTLTTTGNAVDIFTFVYIDSAWYGDCALNFA